VRVPGWARNEPLPSDLYRFADAVDAPVTLTVNGDPVLLLLEKGYVRVTRAWTTGDTIDLDLPMPVRRVRANDAVTADRGRVALQRGPIVYAAEWPDNAAGHVRNLLLPDTAALTAEHAPSLLNGVTVVKGRAVSLSAGRDGGVTRREGPFVAIPYFAWANRGPGEMAVWIAAREDAVRVQPRPTLASASAAASSGGRGLRAVNDLEEPAASNDASVPPFHWWPKKGTTEWVEYAFASPAAVHEVAVYWFDDTGAGETRVPASCRVLYRAGNAWLPVEAQGACRVEKDRYNVMRFAPVTTPALRLEITLQQEWSAGIHEFSVR
jgi:hypothetical protein